MHDNLRNTQMVHLGNLALSGTTPAASAWADLKGFNEATIVMVSNTITDAGTAAGFTAAVQHGDDSTTAGAAAIGTDDSVDGSTITMTELSDTGDDGISGAVGYVGGKRYLRVNVTGTTGTSADVSIYAILGGAARRATTFEGTSVAAT